MKTRLNILTLAAVALLSASCADHRSDYMEDFQTMVYFRNGGEQSLTLYRTGEDGFYRIPVCKSGRNLEGTATATVMPFDEAQMDMYNVSHETSYTLIPSNLFAFTDASRNPLAGQSEVNLSFEKDDTYKVVYVSLKTVLLSALQEANPDAEYVLGFQVFSPEKVSSDINLIVLKPEIEIPLISLVAPGVEVQKYTSASPVKDTLTNTLSLNMDENLWDFDVTLSVCDAAWLADYNNANGKSYELLPASCYNLPETAIHFDEQVLEVPFKVAIDRTDMVMLTEYALPVKVTACTKTEFSIDEKASVYLINLRMDPDQITLTADMIEVSANATNEAGSGPSALVDNVPATYWHSPWSTYVTNPDPVYGIYIDISLKTALKAITFNYLTRTSNGNGVPTHIVVGVSNDKSTWTVIDGGDVETEEMATSTANQWISMPVMKHSEPFKYIRIGVAESIAGDLRQTYTSGTQPWTAIAELQLYGSAN